MNKYQNPSPRFIRIIVIVVLSIIVLVSFSSSIFVTLQPGERGVMFKRFSGGLDKKHIKEPGFHVIAPWNDIIIYNVKEQKVAETMDILDKNGLSIKVDVTVRFNPQYNKIGHLHEKFGATYIDGLVKQEVRASVRQVLGRFEAVEIYSTKRKEVESEIIDATKNVLANNYVEMTTLLIRSISLPKDIKRAIEEKQKQKEIAEAYKYKLQKEQSEVERKKIEAEGNLMLSKSLTPEILRIRAIEATLELAKSSNSKIIVVGNPNVGGLPIMLNSGK